MKNLRKYGKAPYKIAVIHGGPGAGGEMAPIARELASGWGVLEPFQTATSLEGQIEELKTVLEKNGDKHKSSICDMRPNLRFGATKIEDFRMPKIQRTFEHLPVTLIGFSWGAWLSFIFAANYPSFVKKLILIGSGPYEEKYVARIRETRLNRLGEEDRTEVKSVIEILNNPTTDEDKKTAFVRFGALFSKADAYDPIICESDESEVIDCRVDIFQSVWKDAVELRRSGKLLELGKHIKCPVVAIHGDYDPHPAEGVQKPLSAILKSFRFIRLKNCGHIPWIEREAKVKFYEILNEELHHA